MSAVLNGIYIDGSWRAGHEVLEVINPASEPPRAWPNQSCWLRTEPDEYTYSRTPAECQADSAGAARSKGREEGNALMRPIT